MAEQLPPDFTRLVYLPREQMPAGLGESDAGPAAWERRRPSKQSERGLESNLQLALPAEIKHWDREIVADCFSIFGTYTVCLEVYNGDQRRAIEAMCEALVGWNLAFFAVWSLQHLRAAAMGVDEVPSLSMHPTPTD